MFTALPPPLPCPGPLVYFLQLVDKAISRVSPFAAVGVVFGTVYWSAVTYGAVTVMQVRSAPDTDTDRDLQSGHVFIGL